MSKKKVEKNIETITYEFFTLDRKNVAEIISRVDDYYRKNGRTIAGE